MQTVDISLQRLVYAALALILPVFGGALAVAAPPADHSYVVSLRRLTEQEYRNSIADIFGKEIEVRGSFEPTKRSNGLAAVSTAFLSVTPVGFESFNKMADDIAAQVTAEKHRAKLPCSPKDPKAYDEACATKIISHYGLLLFRRPLTGAELDNHLGLARRMTERTNSTTSSTRCTPPAYPTPMQCASSKSVTSPRCLRAIAATSARPPKSSGCIATRSAAHLPSSR